MNERTVDAIAWSPLKFGVAIVVAVLVQLGLILWFSARDPVKVREADAGTVIRQMVGAGGDWLRLTDPTVFTRAHPDGFSGAAWVNVPPHLYLPTNSADSPLWLGLAPESLGTAFREFVRGITPEPQPLRSWQSPPVTAPLRAPAQPRFESSVRVEGALAARGIVSRPDLPAWTNAEVLAPTRVQVLVDARGNPLSAVLLESSGLKAADQSALDLARRMRFGSDPAALKDPAAPPDAGMASGWLDFSWRTLAPVTNGGTAPPP